MPSSRRQKKKQSQKNSSSFGLVMLGVFIGVAIVILLYWRQSNSPDLRMGFAVNETDKQHASSAPKKLEKPAEKKISTTPEFDFYTVLPQAQVVSHQNKPATTTPAQTQPAATSSQSQTTLGTIPATPEPTPASAPPTTEIVATSAATVTSPPVAKKQTTATPTVSAATPAPTHIASPPATSNTINTGSTSSPPASSAAATPTQPQVAVVTPTIESDVLGAPPTVPPQTKQPYKQPVVTPPSVKTPPAKDPENTLYLLQLRSLKNYADADRLKAELTMVGLDVYIQPYTINGQTYSRVVMGPYASKAVALQQQALLQKKHLTSVVIKAH